MVSEELFETNERPTKKPSIVSLNGYRGGLCLCIYLLYLNGLRRKIEQYNFCIFELIIGGIKA